MRTERNNRNTTNNSYIEHSHAVKNIISKNYKL
jgi:hypothetical protein